MKNLQENFQKICNGTGFEVLAEKLTDILDEEEKICYNKSS